MKVVKIEFLQEMKRYLEKHEVGILEEINDLRKREKCGFNDLNFQKDLYVVKLLMYQAFFDHDHKEDVKWQDSFYSKRLKNTITCRDFNFRLAHNATRAGYWSQKDKHALFVHESGKDYVVKVDLLTNTCKTFKIPEIIPPEAEEISSALEEYVKCEIPYWHARILERALDHVLRLDEYNSDLFWTFLQAFMKL